MQRVVIIASSQFRCDASASLFNDSDFRVVGGAAPGDPARSVIARRQPDLIVIDLDHGDRLTEVLDDVQEHSSRAVTVALVNDDDTQHVVPAFQHGARGVLSRERSCDELLDGFRTVLNGGVFIEPRLASQLVLAVTRGVRIAGPYGLSRAEEAVVAQLAHELTNGQIGKRIGVSTSTVKTHLRKAFRKLGVCNRVEAAMLAAERGLA